MVKKLHLLGRSVNLYAVDYKLIGIEVYYKLVVAQLFLLRRGIDLRAAHDRMDARKKLLYLKGLCYIVIRADIEPGDLISHCALGSEHDDGNGRGLAYLTADLHTVHDGHHNVKQHKVGRYLIEHSYAAAAVVRYADLKAVLFKIKHKKLGNINVVFNNKGFFVHSISPLNQN